MCGTGRLPWRRLELIVYDFMNFACAGTAAAATHHGDRQPLGARISQPAGLDRQVVERHEVGGAPSA